MCSPQHFAANAYCGVPWGYRVPLRALAINRSAYEPTGGLKIEDSARAEAQRDMWADFILDTAMLAASDVLVAQFFSTLANLAFFARGGTEYAAVDCAFPCPRGGCPTPLPQSPLCGMGRVRQLMPFLFAPELDPVVAAGLMPPLYVDVRRRNRNRTAAEAFAAARCAPCVRTDTRGFPRCIP